MGLEHAAAERAHRSELSAMQGAMQVLRGQVREQLSTMSAEKTAHAQVRHSPRMFAQPWPSANKR